jgi:flagellar hook-basal body complex protein FliE
MANVINLTREIQNNVQQKLQAGTASNNDFWHHFNAALAQVAQAQVEAGSAAQAFESGKEVDVAKVMLAREKASLAFEATMQIRNKLLSAYKDIMSMPV